MRPSAGPLPRPFDVRKLERGAPKTVAIDADPQECAAVAAALGLPALHALSAEIRLVARAGGTVEATGRVHARLDQICVVTLEPFESAVDQPIDLRFAPAAAPVEEPAVRGRRGRSGEKPSPRDVTLEVVVPVGGNDDQEDPPDAIVDDTIDLGALAVEFLALGLEPYPRRPGVHFDDTVLGEKGEPAPSAFAALARLKDGS